MKCWRLSLCRYDIQTGFHDPYEDCVSVMRLYKRMRDLEHRKESIGGSLATQCARNITGDLASRNTKEFKKMTPDVLYQLSKSNYWCWCLDQSQNTHNNQSFQHIQYSFVKLKRIFFFFFWFKWEYCWKLIIFSCEVDAPVLGAFLQ